MVVVADQDAASLGFKGLGKLGSSYLPAGLPEPSTIRAARTILSALITTSIAKLLDQKMLRAEGKSAQGFVHQRLVKPSMLLTLHIVPL